jgi:hypothetical protein
MKMDPFGTHQALLVAALAATHGPIVEMGGGYYSTPLVSAFSGIQGRTAYTLETGEFVYDKLKPYHSGLHQVLLMPGYRFDQIGKFTSDGTPNAKVKERQREYLEVFWKDHQANGGGRFSVAFIDQAPGFLRTPAIEFFRDKADFVMTHDSEHVEHYHLEPLISSFGSRFDYDVFRPNSVILSDTKDCSQFRFLLARPTE